jgi:hypothetical protein
MSRAAGKAKQNALTHAGARVPTALYRRVMAKVGAEGTTLRQVLMDLLEVYVQDNHRAGSASQSSPPPVPPPSPRP